MLLVPHAETLQQKLSLRAIHKLIKEKTSQSLRQSEVHLRYDSWNADLKNLSYHFKALIETSVFHSSESLAKVHRRKTSADRFCGITSKLSDVMPPSSYSSWEDPEPHTTSTNIQSRCWFFPSSASSKLRVLTDRDQCLQWPLSCYLTAWLPVSSFISDIISSSSKASWLCWYMLDFDIQKWTEP